MHDSTSRGDGHLVTRIETAVGDGRSSAQERCEIPLEGAWLCVCWKLNIFTGQVVADQIPGEGEFRRIGCLESFQERSNGLVQHWRFNEDPRLKILSLSVADQANSLDTILGVKKVKAKPNARRMFMRGTVLEELRH
jgi:hypothetical protein